MLEEFSKKGEKAIYIPICIVNLMVLITRMKELIIEIIKLNFYSYSRNNYSVKKLYFHIISYLIYIYIYTRTHMRDWNTDIFLYMFEHCNTQWFVLINIDDYKNQKFLVIIISL